MSEDFPHYLEYTRLLLNEFSCNTDVADFLTWWRVLILPYYITEQCYAFPELISLCQVKTWKLNYKYFPYFRENTDSIRGMIHIFVYSISCILLITPSSLELLLHGWYIEEVFINLPWNLDKSYICIYMYVCMYVCVCVWNDVPLFTSVTDLFINKSVKKKMIYRSIFVEIWRKKALQYVLLSDIVIVIYNITILLWNLFSVYYFESPKIVLWFSNP